MSSSIFHIFILLFYLITRVCLFKDITIKWQKIVHFLLLMGYSSNHRTIPKTFFFSFHTWYFTCFNAILPNLPTLSLSHRVHKTGLYISVSFAVSSTCGHHRVLSTYPFHTSSSFLSSTCVLCAKSLHSVDSLRPWTVAHQAPQPMGFFRQEYWSLLPCLPPEDLPDAGTEPELLTSPAGTLSLVPPGKPSIV